VRRRDKLVDNPKAVIEDLKSLCSYAESFPEGKERQFVLKQIRALLLKNPELLHTMPDDLHEALGRLLNW